MTERQEISRRELLTGTFRRRDGLPGDGARVLPDPDVWEGNMDRVLESMGDLSGIEEPQAGLEETDTGSADGLRLSTVQPRRRETS